MKEGDVGLMSGNVKSGTIAPIVIPSKTEPSPIPQSARIRDSRTSSPILREDVRIAFGRKELGQKGALERSVSQTVATIPTTLIIAENSRNETSSDKNAQILHNLFSALRLELVVF